MKTFNILFSGLILCLLSACGSKEPSPLVGQTDRLNGELTELAEGSPLFMSEATASYTDGTISVTISLSDPDISAQELTDPLLQFVVAKYMQLHSDDNLITTLNALGKEKGTLSLTVEDAAGDEKVLVLPSATLKRLATAKPIDLRIGDVRLAVLDIMDGRCKEFREAVKAESCEFDYVSSFAQYTFTFASPNQFSNLNAASLAGRYQHPLEEIYSTFGDCRPIIEDMLQSLEIDGYRIIYTGGDKTLKTSLPWRLIKSATTSTTQK